MGVPGMNVRQIAPGPRGDLLLGNVRAFRRDVLGLMMESAREYGDVCLLYTSPSPRDS